MRKRTLALGEEPSEDSQSQCDDVGPADAVQGGDKTDKMTGDSENEKVRGNDEDKGEMSHDVMVTPNDAEGENTHGEPDGGHSGEAEGEEPGSDEEQFGFVTMDDNFNMNLHGQVSPYSMQLMQMIANLTMRGAGSAPGMASGSSSSAPAPLPPHNPGSRQERRAARNERLRKMRAKGGR